jgi:peptidylprolyl isomerase
VVDGEPILIDYYAEAADDGSLVNETYSGDPRSYLLNPESLGLDIYRALSGHTVGSRILQLVPAREAQTTATVAVFDILPTRAVGDAVAPAEGLPQVELAGNGAPSITIPDSPPPTDLVVQPLIRGLGEQVAPGQVVTVQYTGVTWSDGEVFDSSWASGRLPVPFPIGVGSVIEGWDSGLVEQTVGSQVLLIVPPYLGWGGTESELADETLVFVVDILAARGRGAE